MEPARLRPAATISQRVQDIAERLSTHAKAELYEVLEGLAPSGEVASLLRLEPLVNDIVSQLNDNFKQAVTKRLLPEACKLLGTRPSASGWPANPPGTAQAAGTPSSASRQQLHPDPHPHHDNDILALAFAPGTNQPLRPDQGPPQDAASAAASSLLLGASASSAATAAAGGPSDATSHLHPHASRFAFANAAEARQRNSLLGQSQQPYLRSSQGGTVATGGGANGGAVANDTMGMLDPLLFLGLGESGNNGAVGAGVGLGSLGQGALDLANGAMHGAGNVGTGADSLGGGYVLGHSSNNGSGRTTLDGGVGGTGGGLLAAVTSPSPPSSVASSHGLPSGRLVSSHQGTPNQAQQQQQLQHHHQQQSGNALAAGGSAAAAVRQTASSSASSVASPSYTSMSLGVRPGSSLDPGLATPPVSLAGTEPLRPIHLALQPQQQQQQPQQQQQQHPQQQQQHLLLQGDQPYGRMSDQLSSGGRLGAGGYQAYGRLSGPGDGPAAGSALPPPPLFGGAPGPSPSPGGGNQAAALQRQQQAQEQHLVSGAGLEQGLLLSSSFGGAFANGNGGDNGFRSTPPPSPPLHQLQHQQQLLHQQQQQLLHQHQQHQQLLHQQQQQQQQLAYVRQQSPQPQHQPSDGGGHMLLSAGNRNAYTAAPDGPRVGQDADRAGLGFLNNGSNTTGNGMYALQQHYHAVSEPQAYGDAAQGQYGSGGGSLATGMQQMIVVGGGGGGASTRFANSGDATSLAFRGGGGGGFDAAAAAGAPGGAVEYGMYGFPPLSSGGGAPRDAALLLHQSLGGPLVGAAPGAAVSVAAVSPFTPGRAGGVSPTVGLLTAPPPAAGSSLAPGGGGGGRTSRSGAASAGSVADSRSSSFSAGPVGPQGPGRHGSLGAAVGASAAAVQPPPPPPPSAAAGVQAHQLHPSPPASDASGPSSLASVSTSGGGGLAAVAPAVAAGGKIVPAAAALVIGSPGGSSGMSMAAKLQQVAAKPPPSPVGRGGKAVGPGGAVGSPAPGAVGLGAGCGLGAVKAPADLPGRFRCLPPSVQARIYTLTRDNHVVLLKDFDEKVLSKMTLLVDKFGAGECLAMLDRIEEVLKGKAGRLANGPGYLDVSVSTRLDELKQRASGQVTAPEDYARSTLHSRIYAELRDLIARHGFLQWQHFDQGIINMLKKMPNATALERLNELAYHSFKNVDNPKSCIVSIFTTKPKYVNA